MRKTTFIIGAIIAACIFLSSASFAFEPSPLSPMMQGPGRFMPAEKSSPHGFMPAAGIRLLTDCIQINVISELTGLTRENVKQLLISSPPPAVLDAYGISNESFRTAMDKASLKLIDQAASLNLISRNQIDEIKNKLNRKESNPPDSKR